MFRRIVLTLLLAATLLVPGGCAGEATVETGNEPGILYENKIEGLKVYHTPEWYMDQEVIDKHFNVTFTCGNTKAIITVISKDKPLDEIKRELMIGAGQVSLIEEKSNYLAFKSERPEIIRTDIFISQSEHGTGIVTFMTPLKDYQGQQDAIEDFRNNVEFY